MQKVDVDIKNKIKEIALLEHVVFDLTASLPADITLRPSLYFKRKKDITSLHFLKAPLLKNIDTQVFFSYSKHKIYLFGKEGYSGPLCQVKEEGLPKIQKRPFFSATHGGM